MDTLYLFFTRLASILAALWGLQVAYAQDRIPSHYDLRELVDEFPPVILQHTCGGTWAFGTIDTMTIAIALKDKKVVDLSEQHVISCNNQMFSCTEGGYPQLPMMVNPGAVLESDFPFAGKQIPCKKNLPIYQKATAWANVPVEPGRNFPSDEAIKKSILLHGPVMTSVDASRWGQYKGGIHSKCSLPPQINHLVNLIGWDDAGGYWIARNTWGHKWGEKGHIHLKYDCDGVGRMFTSYLKF